MNDKLCDQINLSDFNQIQSHGALLVLDANFIIIQYSENAPHLLSTPDTALLNQPILDFLQSSTLEDLNPNWIQESQQQYTEMMWHLPDSNIPILIFTHSQAGQFIIEIEKNVDIAAERLHHYDVAQRVIATMNDSMHCETIDALGKSVCAGIKNLTGYDRVIIYKFNEQDHSGMVVGEALSDGLEPYLGLHFPANDVPTSVRDSYLKLPLRYIANIQDNPVKILPSGNGIDLSVTYLRMVAPVHVKYMHNMGITSSVSIAIMHGAVLWGLIACHHREPKYLTLNQRLVLLMLANIVSTQITTIESTAQYKDEQHTIALQSILSLTLKESKSLGEALELHYSDLMNLVSAQGMSVYLQNVLLNYGETPASDQVLQLISWLEEKKLSSTYSTVCLPLDYEPSLAYKDKACGLLAIKITSLDNHYLLFYKPELVNTISWAGNPSNTIEITKDSYNPRESFKLFLETIRDHSSRWTTHDISSTSLIHSLIAAKQLQDLLQDQVLHDPLTHLLNRRYLEQTLTLEIHRASREKMPLAVIMLDLDYFKTTNDKLGHLAGDALLRGFADLLKAQFRRYDYIYRYGGDEFFLLLPDVSLASAKEKAETLRLKAKDMKIPFNGGVLPPITITLGLAAYPEHGTEAHALISKADAVLYEGKKGGRDRVLVAT